MGTKKNADETQETALLENSTTIESDSVENPTETAIETQEEVKEEVLENMDITQADTQENKEELFSVAELAIKYRVPEWQLVALLKLLDIEDDKLLTKQEFVWGLEALTKRKMGH